MANHQFDSDEIRDMREVAILTVAISKILDKHMQKHIAAGNAEKTAFFKERRDTALLDLHWEICFPLWAGSTVEAGIDDAMAEEVLKFISEKC